MAILSRIQGEYTIRKEKEKKKKMSRNTFQAGATVDAKDYSVKITYLPIGTYLYLTLVTLVV